MSKEHRSSRAAISSNGDNMTVKINVGWKTRGYFLHVPKNYSGQSNVPFIID
jgi:hypothetical protein